MHHALLVRGELEHVLELYDLKKDLHSPDVSVLSCPQCTISDVRRIKEYAYQRPVVLQKRYFLIHTQDITHEAQNALLKIFEEPPQTAQFFLIVDTPSFLLPTLRSRLQDEVFEGVVEKKNTDFKKFYTSTVPERLSMIEKELKGGEGGAWVRSVMSGLQNWIANQKGSVKKEILKDVSLVLTYHKQKGASQKMLLEHLAFILPATS